MLEVTRIVKKTKALALLSIIVAATVFGAVILSVSATEEAPNEESIEARRGLPHRLLEDLTEEQRETLLAKIEGNQVEIKANRDEIKAQLKEWGIEIPPPQQHPRGFLEDLTEEQKEELKAMRQEFDDAVKSKFEEWGIEVPQFDGMRHGPRGPRRFCPFKP
jgi:hypothetical protein